MNQCLSVTCQVGLLILAGMLLPRSFMITIISRPPRCLDLNVAANEAVLSDRALPSEPVSPSPPLAPSSLTISPASFFSAQKTSHCQDAAYHLYQRYTLSRSRSLSTSGVHYRYSEPRRAGCVSPDVHLGGIEGDRPYVIPLKFASRQFSTTEPVAEMVRSIKLMKVEARFGRLGTVDAE